MDELVNEPEPQGRHLSPRKWLKKRLHRKVAACPQCLLVEGDLPPEPVVTSPANMSG